MTRYLVYDVFTQTRFGGNQLAIFPDASALSEEVLQPLAREFNFAEVVFLFPPENPSHTARMRIFTPTSEIPFAGHPTIGTAIALADLGHGPDMVLELGIGPLACTTGDHGAAFTTPVQLQTLAQPDPSLVASALGIHLDQIETRVHLPTMATLGLPFTITQLKTRAALAACQPVTDAMCEGACAHPEGLDFAQFAYWRDGDTLHARMFAPLDNIPEDAATGSACATVTALLAQLEARDLALVIHQGNDMGRPSLINTRSAPDGITVQGHAVKVMEGTFL